MSVSDSCVIHAAQLSALAAAVGCCSDAVTVLLQGLPQMWSPPALKNGAFRPLGASALGCASALQEEDPKKRYVCLTSAPMRVCI